MALAGGHRLGQLREVLLDIKRLAQALVGVAFACGGEGGARLALRLGMPTSPDTLLVAVGG